MRIGFFFQKLKLARQGLAIIELALFIPIAYILLHMILDTTTLYRCKDKIQAVTALAVEITLSTITKHGQITKENMKDIAKNVFNSFDDKIPTKFNCRLNISWEFLRKSDDLYYSYAVYKYPNKDVAVEESSNYSISGTRDYFSNANLNGGENDTVVIVTVSLEQADSRSSWFGVSEFTYNIARKSMPKKFFAQSIIYPQHELQFPDDVY